MPKFFIFLKVKLCVYTYVWLAMRLHAMVTSLKQITYIFNLYAQLNTY